MSSTGNKDNVQTDDAQLTELINRHELCSLEDKPKRPLKPFKVKPEEDDAQALAKHLLPVLCREQKELGEEALRQLFESSSTMAELLNAKGRPFHYQKAANNAEFLRKCAPIFQKFLFDEMFRSEKQHAADVKAHVAENEALKQQHAADVKAHVAENEALKQQHAADVKAHVAENEALKQQLQRLRSETAIDRPHASSRNENAFADTELAEDNGFHDRLDKSLCLFAQTSISSIAKYHVDYNARNSRELETEFSTPARGFHDRLDKSLCRFAQTSISSIAKCHMDYNARNSRGLEIEQLGLSTPSSSNRQFNQFNVLSPNLM